MSAQHIDAGVEMSFRIGQRVRHQDYKGQRVTGVVRGLSVESDGGLTVSIALDAPIVIPARDGCPAINIHWQSAPAHEFRPFDERDELIAEMLATLKDVLRIAIAASIGITGNQPRIERAKNAIAKAEGKSS